MVFTSFFANISSNSVLWNPPVTAIITSLEFFNISSSCLTLSVSDTLISSFFNKFATNILFL